MSFNATSYKVEGHSSTDIAEVAAGTPTIVKEWVGTNFEDYTFVNTWAVKGLKTLTKGDASIKSAPFTHQNKSKWCMVLTKQADGLYLNFVLEKCEPDARLSANLTAYEILPNGEKREVYPSEWCFLKEGWSSDRQIVRKVDTVQENTRENEITLQCEVCMQCIVHDELPAADTTEVQTDVVRAVAEILHKDVHSDFELHAGGKILRAHKAILAVRSPYFAAMLQPHTKEAREGCVEVNDMKPQVLKQVLLFMYTGGAPALKEMPWDLLIAADKYQLQQLKRQCEVHIAGCLNVDNAAETAANASVFSCDLLWDWAVRFIKHNLSEVMRTPGWATAIIAHPEAIQRISELMG